MLHQLPDLDALFHALSDGSRRQMLDQLTRGPASVSQLARPLDMSLSAVVQHVRVLEDAGLIRTQKVGRVRQCRLDADALAQVERWLADRRGLWERRLDIVGALLAAQEPPSE